MRLLRPDEMDPKRVLVILPIIFSNYTTIQFSSNWTNTMLLTLVLLLNSDNSVRYVKGQFSNKNQKEDRIAIWRVSEEQRLIIGNATPGTWEAEAEGLHVWGQLGLHNEFHPGQYGL